MTEQSAFTKCINVEMPMYVIKTYSALTHSTDYITYLHSNV